jgi:hypothetical protein
LMMPKNENTPRLNQTTPNKQLYFQNRPSAACNKFDVFSKYAQE